MTTEADAHKPAVAAGATGLAGAAFAGCSAACAGCAPPVLGLLGLSSSSAMLSWLGWLRPMFFTLSAVALGVAFWRAYRRPARTARALVWSMAGMTLLMFGLPHLTAAVRTEPPPPCATPCP